LHRRRAPVGHFGQPSILNASPKRRRWAVWLCSKPATACGSICKAGTVNRADRRGTGRAPGRAEAKGGYPYPASQTPWQEIQRALVGQMNTGAILEGAEKYQRIAQTRGLRATTTKT
jgi:dihydroxy-acid dehydratase